MPTSSLIKDEAAEDHNAPFSIIDFGGRGGLNFLFNLSKMIAQFKFNLHIQQLFLFLAQILRQFRYVTDSQSSAGKYEHFRFFAFYTNMHSIEQIRDLLGYN